MTSQPEISMTTLFPYLVAAKRLDIQLDYEAIGQKYDLTPDYLTDHNKRLSLQQLSEIVGEAENSLQDCLLGLKAAAKINFKKLTRFNELIRRGHHVHDALEILIRYFPIFSEFGQLRLDCCANSGYYRLVFESDTAPQVNRHIIDGRMMFLYRYAQTLGGTGFCELHLRHTCPSDHQDSYRAHYPIPVHFQQSETCFLFDSQWLDQPLPPHISPDIQQLSRAESALRETRGTQLEEQIEFILRHALASGTVSGNQVADALGMNLRTLQRRLKANNQTFAHLLERTRARLAIEYLANPDNSINQISVWLGYSDLSSFLRAFKHWTGIGPGKYRQRFISAANSAFSTHTLSESLSRTAI